jgi:hypothetical protein
MDTQAEAEAAVDRLFKLLAVRAGKPAPSDRLITRDELVEAVGGLTGMPASDRWPTAVSAEYTESVAAGPALMAVLPTLTSFRTDQPGSRELAVTDLLAITDPVLLVGRTGSGKSTTAAVLRWKGAGQGAAVIVCHAEAYVQQRLDALVADSIGALVSRDLARVVGRQALNDPLVLIAVDGVSEIAPSTREALAAEVRAHLAAGRGARMVLIGRDEAATATLLPTMRPACASARPRLIIRADFNWHGTPYSRMRWKTRVQGTTNRMTHTARMAGYLVLWRATRRTMRLIAPAVSR